MTFCNLSANILVNNLMLQFNKEIGLKSFTVYGLLTFGMRVMKEELILSRFTVPSKNS